MIEKITMRQIQDEYYKVNDESQKDTKPKIIKNDSDFPAGQKLLSPTNILPPSPMDIISMPSPDANLLVEASASSVLGIQGPASSVLGMQAPSFSVRRLQEPITVHVTSETVPTTPPAEKSDASTKIIDQ
jgi:hypothetical protein